MDDSELKDKVTANACKNSQQMLRNEVEGSI